MDDTIQMEEPTRDRSKRSPIIGAIALVVLLAIGGYFFYYTKWSYIKDVSDLQPTELIEAKRTGDYATAINQYQKIQSNALAKPDEKALAVFNIIGAKFQLSGNIEDQISDIREMKKVVLDKNVALWTRVNVLNILSASFCGSGRDPMVFKEIYKDAPFNSFFAEGDPDLSARHVSEWSYSLKPTSFAAIRIARWYSEQKTINPKLAATTTAEYAAKAAEYLASAERNAEQEASEDPQYFDSARYAIYRYWRAIIIGRLAKQIGEPYSSRYATEYDAFIKFTLTQKNAVAKDYLFFARLFFAQAASRDGNTVTSKTQLDQLAQELNMLSNPNVITFVRFVRSEHQFRPTGPNWRGIEAMYKVSPNFKAAIETLIASSPQSGNTSAVPDPYLVL